MARMVAGEMKWVTCQIHKTTIVKVNTEAKKQYHEVPVNERQQLKEEVERELLTRQ